MTVRVLHLTGSPTSDLYADLSRLYAADCLSALSVIAGYEHYIADVSPDRTWRFPSDLTAQALAAAEPLAFSDAVRRIETLHPDVGIPQLFCLAGMTSYRALFDLLGVPFLGNTADVMALGADKAKAKAVVAADGVDVPAGELLHRGERPTLTPPVVVKPADADNSLGLSLVRHSSEYPAALDSAFAHSATVLVEEFIELGREVRCSVIVRAGKLVCLPLEEYDVDPQTRPVRLYADKVHRRDDGGLELVAKDEAKAWTVPADDPVTARVWAAARRCHIALGCRDYSLFDFRIDPTGRPVFLEAGLYCSFARQSVITMMAQAAGVPLEQLFGAAVEQALARAPRPGSGATPS